MTKNLLSSNCTATDTSLFLSAKRAKERFDFSSAMNMLFIVLMVFIMAGCGSSSSSSSNSLPPLTDAFWVALQDGESGDWEEIDIPADGVLNISDHISAGNTEGKYGVAIVRASATEQRVDSFTVLTTVNELPEIDFNVISSDLGSATLQVEVEEPSTSDFPSGSYVRLNLHDDYTGISSGFTYTQSFTKTPGTYDLIVTRADSYDDTPTHLAERRDLTLTEGATLEETIASDEFNISNALDGPYTITVLNGRTSDTTDSWDSNLFDGEVNLLTAHDTEAELGEKNFSDTNFRYAALGSSLLAGSDIYMLNIYIEPDDNSCISYFEGFRTEGDKEVTPPSDPFLGAFTTTTVGANLLPGLTGTAYADAIGYTTQFDGRADGIDYLVSGHVSAARTAGDDISFVLPDLSSAPGWSARWSLPATATMDYTAASVQVGEIGVTLENFTDWYFTDTTRLANGEWFASIANFVYGDSGGEPL